MTEDMPNPSYFRLTAEGTDSSAQIPTLPALWAWASSPLRSGTYTTCPGTGTQEGLCRGRIQIPKDPDFPVPS